MALSPTETFNPHSEDLDARSLTDMLEVLLNDQALAAQAVRAALPQLEVAVREALPRMQQGGRLLYVGAGTSGRLGVLDGTELNPTFSWPPSRAVGVIAGGTRAITEAVEGAEDDAAAGITDLQGVNCGANDVVLGLAASGNTPYVVAALGYAKGCGALTVGIANNPNGQVLQAAEVAVLLDTGPEVISGSTRLKAGTAQKIALNCFSSALMVSLGKVYKNLMVDVRATNAKLRLRAVRLVQAATGCDETEATTALVAANGHVKLAILMLVKNLDATQAAQQLEVAGGMLRVALQNIEVRNG